MAKSFANRLTGTALFDEYHRALYSTDASIYQIRPAGIILPATVEDVCLAVEVARQRQVPLIPRGGGTSLSGQSIGPGLILDFSRHFNRILEIDAEKRLARIQPGVVLDQLNMAAARHGLQFGPDVATSNRANLGGMIGNNSAGSRSVWYGKTVDHVQSLDVVLMDGTRTALRPLTGAELAAAQQSAGLAGKVYRDVASIIARERDEIVGRFPRIIRRVSGYNLDEFVPSRPEGMPQPPFAAEVRQRDASTFPDADFNLAKLIVGAEGTLATVVEAVVHLVPLPAARGVVVLHFDSLAHAVDAVLPILACRPSAAELFDAQILRLAEKSLEYRHYLDFVVGRPESLMLVEFSGDDMGQVRDGVAALRTRLRGQPGLENVLEALEPEVYRHVWACRKAALPLLLGMPGPRKPIAFVEDPAVNPDRLPQFVERFCQLLRQHSVEGAFYGHASVGCLHIRPMLDLTDRGDLEHLRRISGEVAALVQEFGGSMSGEHGDGLARSYLNERLFGPRLYQAFREIKHSFDPDGLLNPGKVVEGPSPTDNLRFGADYHRLPVTTTFDFSREGSLAQAAEMCNGAGVCRKLLTGTMCPSFMATGDEEHSTRGRANALRLVLSGALPREELTGPNMFATYDLCLQCKGCKAECPSNVDVAKLKMEFLDHYYRRHGAPLGVRLLAQAGRLNRWGAALAPLSNWAGRLPGAGWLGERLLGLDRRRPLPQFHRDHFRHWFHRTHPAERDGSAASPGASAERPPILLLDDCLTSFCEPAVNLAAVEVLEAAGYHVHLAGLGCCGRTFASKGLLGEAQRLARENIRRLLPWAERGVPIVGCEPSCLLMLVDEYPDLVPGDDARRVAQSAALVDSHLARTAAPLRLEPLNGDAVLHGHCHQKALVGLADTQSTLARIAGLKVTTVDSGCCGMAGSFGYEHYDLSLRIGERVLFPAVRQAPADSVIVAPGFSCRQQIAHGTGRHALHPVEVLARQLPRPANDRDRTGLD